MSEPIEICCKCGQDIRMTKDNWEREVHLSDPTFSGMPMPVGGYFYHKRCPDMSETKENLCPECGHPRFCHPTINKKGTCGAGSCGCIRSYESLVGEKRTLMQCIHCKLISSDNNPVEECKVSTCHDWGVFTPDAEPEPSLQLLVLDMGDCCVVRLEHPNTYNLPSIHGERLCDTLFGKYKTAVIPNTTFAELRSAIDGEKPVPRIERGNGGGYRLFDCNDKFGHELCEDAFRVYQETVGKPLPIYSGGKWEDLQPKTGLGWEMPVGIWRFTR